VRHVDYVPFGLLLLEVVFRGPLTSFDRRVADQQNAADLREALAVVPTDRLLVETDAPFLTPTPYRGRPNASYLVPVTVRTLAAERDADLEVLCRALESNTFAAYGG